MEECVGEGVLAGLIPPLGDLSLRSKEPNLSLVLDLDRPTVAAGSISGSDPEGLADRPFLEESGVCDSDGPERS
jgi:hypothetical protein